MKTVIQHTSAPLYWSPRGWTGNPTEALVFLDEVRARDYLFFHDIDQGTSAVVEDTRCRKPARQGNRSKRPIAALTT